MYYHTECLKRKQKGSEKDDKIKADIQYIINPFNGEVSLPNALVGIFRLCVEI